LQSLVADDDAGGGASDGDTCPTAPATKAKSKADTRPRTLATRAKSMATAQASAKSAAEASRPTHVPAQEPGEGGGFKYHKLDMTLYEGLCEMRMICPSLRSQPSFYKLEISDLLFCLLHFFGRLAAELQPVNFIIG